MRETFFSNSLNFLDSPTRRARSRIDIHTRVPTGLRAESGCATVETRELATLVNRISKHCFRRFDRVGDAPQPERPAVGALHRPSLQRGVGCYLRRGIAPVAALRLQALHLASEIF